MPQPPLSYDTYGRPIADNKQVSISEYLQASQPADDTAPVARLSQHPLQLIVRAIGPPAVVINKIWRLAVTLFNTFYIPAQRKRLQRLQQIGFIEAIPSQKQLWFGAMDMLRYFISPGADSYYKTKGINFTFHQVLRLLNDPSGIADPIGIRVPRDTIICHLLEVVHANPVYDLQLLDQFADGLDEMEKQAGQMIDGTHARYQSITAITEDSTYHQRLLEYVKRYRQNPAAKQMVRASGQARSDKYFLLAECMFGTLPSAFRYFNRLPDSWGALLAHYRSNPHINPALCDEWIVEQVFNKN